MHALSLPCLGGLSLEDASSVPTQCGEESQLLSEVERLVVEPFDVEIQGGKSSVVAEILGEELRMDQHEQQRHRQFLRLFAANEAAVHGFVRSLVSRREDAAEVMQEVAVVLWEKFDEFDNSRDFRKWACGVARFEVLAFLRDRARDRHVFDETLLMTLAEEAVADEAGEARRKALESCLEKLQPRQRELTLAAYKPGARIDMLAEQRGQTAMSLYKVLHRTRNELLECIKRTLGADGLA